MNKIKPAVELLGSNSNAFAILGKVTRALKNNGYSKEEIAQYNKEAMSGDYQNLLSVTAKWVDIE